MKRTMTLILWVVSAVAFLTATVPPKSGVMTEQMKKQMEKIRLAYNEGYWAQRMEAKRSIGLNQTHGVSAVPETVFVPVLFGKYSNSVEKYTAAKFQEHLFDGPNPTKTLTQFYTEISYGQMLLTGDCLGWYSTPRSFDYYVHDGGSRNAGLVYGGPDFTIDLMVEADKTVDFSKYVKYVDAEGAHVPQLGIVHTGADAASGGDNIWSHRWNIRWRLNQRKSSGTDTIVIPSNVLASGRYITNDTYQGQPVIIDGDYAIHPELAGSSNLNGDLKQIGVFAHEFGHIFGLPDLYDTDGSSEGLGNWCLMAGGSYGGDGNHEATPVHMSAWCKVQLGWAVPTVVTTQLLNQPIKYAEKYPNIYQLNVKNTPGGQYFLVENRYKTGFDEYLNASGLLIYHIDPSKTSNQNENNYKVDVEQADGLRNLNLGNNRSDNGDPFPGATNNRTFDTYSAPNSKDYALQPSYVGVRNISNADTVMHADFDIGTRPYIHILSFATVEAVNGNGNGRIDPGETGTMQVQLANEYPVATSQCSIKVTTNVAGVSIDSTIQVISVGSLGEFNGMLNAQVSANASLKGQKVPFTVHISTPEQSTEKTFNGFVGYPALVLIDIDSAQTEKARMQYEQLAANGSLLFESVSKYTGTYNNLALNARSTAILFSGRSKFNIIPDSLGQALTDFVNGGGKLFVTGQNIAEDLKQRNSPYLASLFKASWKKNQLFNKVIYGVPGDQFGTALPKVSIAAGTGVNNQVSADVIDVDTNAAHPSFRWTAGASTDYAGLWWEHPTSGGKLVYWSFGLEALNDTTSGAKTRPEAFAAVMNWLNGPMSTPEFVSSAPVRYLLDQNYPNPFNPVTTISFSLPRNGFVSITVYDILGKEVATLVKNELAAGEYRYPFDASALASGIYYYRLQAENFSSTKKMVLLK